MPNPKTLPENRSSFLIRLALETLAIFACCLGWFGWGLASEPHFMDESAYISQSFYADLLREGRWNHPAWLDYAACDLPPLPKYMIGVELWIEGFRRPSLADSRTWYKHLDRQFVGLPGLVAARRPSVLVGAIGVVAIFWLGTLAFDHRVGGLAAFFLAVNPLYRLHARRAMSDVPAECFIILSLVFGLMAWKRTSLRGPSLRSVWIIGVAGVMVGLATLSKLNGVLSGLVLASWIAVAMASKAFTPGSKRFLVAGTVLAVGVALGTFTALNPFLTAQLPEPVSPELASGAHMNFPQRIKAVFDHRAKVSVVAMNTFPNDALPTLLDRLSVVLVQGFGRFGPMGRQGVADSTIRFDPRQDWGALLWVPTVSLGLMVLLRRGLDQFRQGVPPLAALIVAYFVVVDSVVTSFLPLAWDRYMMSIQPPSALIASMFLVWCFDRLSGRGRVASESTL